jgi:para-nitrobenzyl esterase
MTAEKWKSYASALFQDRAAEFLKLYPGDTDAQALRSAIDYGSDTFIAFGTWKWIEAHSQTGDSPVYRYHFELSRASPANTTPHLCLPLRRHRVRLRHARHPARPVWPEDRKLSDQMMSYWTNFARDRRPQRPRPAPPWPLIHLRHHLRARHRAPALIHLDSTHHLRPGHNVQSARATITGSLPQPRQIRPSHSLGPAQ